MLIAVFFSRCRQAMSSRCLIDAACACDDRQRDRNLPRRFPQSSRPFNPDGSLRDWIREFTIRKRRGPIPGESNFNKPIRFSPYPYRARNLVECAFVSQRAETSSLTCLRSRSSRVNQAVASRSRVYDPMLFVYSVFEKYSRALR